MLDWYVFIGDGHQDPGDAGSTATGFFRIDFVPEPSAALLLAAGLAALGASAIRRTG